MVLCVHLPLYVGLLNGLFNSGCALVRFSGQTAEGDTYATIRGYVDGEIVSIKINDETNVYLAEGEAAYATAIKAGDMIQS